MNSSCHASGDAAESRAEVLERLLREALGVHAAPDVVEDMLHGARTVGEALPDGADRDRAVLSGVLAACREQLGADVAEMVEQEVSMLLGPRVAASPREDASRSDARDQRPGPDRFGPPRGSIERTVPREGSEPPVTIEIEVDVDEEWASDVYVTDGFDPFSGTTRPREAVSTEASAGGASRDSGPQTLVPRAVRRIVLVTASEGLHNALRSGLPPGTSLVVVGSLFDLLDAVQSEAGELVVVLDCVRPAVGSSSVATLWPDFPEGTRLLLWGGGEVAREEILLLLGEEVAPRLALVPEGLDHLVSRLLAW